VCVLKNEFQQLSEQKDAEISELRRQHTSELERLSRDNAAEVQKLVDKLSRQEEPAETESSELVYYQRHLEAVEQITELHNTVAEQQTWIEDLRGTLQHRDTEIEELKAKVVSLNTSNSDLMAAVQLNLEHVTAER